MENTQRILECKLVFKIGDIVKLKKHDRAPALVKIISKADEIDIKYKPYLKGMFVIEFEDGDSAWVTPDCLEEKPWSVS